MFRYFLSHFYNKSLAVWIKLTTSLIVLLQLAADSELTLDNITSLCFIDLIVLQ